MNRLIFLLLAALLFSQCKSDSAKGANATTGAGDETQNLLAGHWIAIDFCSRASQYGSVLEAMNVAHKPFAYAYTFNPAYPDSVECSNGDSKTKLPYRIVKDTMVEVMGARGDRSLFLVMIKQGDNIELTAFDPTPAGTKTDRYIKSKAGAEDGITAFYTALNHNMLKGTFSIGSEQKVQFSPGGFILNFKAYDRYKLCATGSCLEAGTSNDIITLYKAKVPGSEKTLIYAYNENLDVLTLAEVVQTGGPKGTATKGKTMYTFKRSNFN